MKFEDKKIILCTIESQNTNWSHYAYCPMKNVPDELFDSVYYDFSAFVDNNDKMSDYRTHVCNINKIGEITERPNYGKTYNIVTVDDLDNSNIYGIIEVCGQRMSYSPGQLMEFRQGDNCDFIHTKTFKDCYIAKVNFYDDSYSISVDVGPCVCILQYVTDGKTNKIEKIITDLSTVSSEDFTIISVSYYNECFLVKVLDYDGDRDSDIEIQRMIVYTKNDDGEITNSVICDEKSEESFLSINDTKCDGDLLFFTGVTRNNEDIKFTYNFKTSEYNYNIH